MEKKDVYELTNPQKSIWLTEQYYKGTNINTICGTIFFKENVDVNLLQKTVIKYIKLNDAMRTRIIAEGGTPKQYINNDKISEIEVYNLNTIQELHELENKISKNPFNIIDSDLYIFKVFKLKNGNGGIIGHLHHLISDAWSFGLMSKELKDIYECLAFNKDYKPDIPSYTEYISKEQEYISSDKFIKDKEYWENSYLTTPELSTIKPYDNNINNTESKRYTATLDEDLCKKINDYAKNNSTSAYSFLMSVYSVYLAVVSGLDNIVIGTPFLNRSNFKEKNTIGMFVNTLPNKLDIDWNLKFSEYLKYTTTEQRNMFRHSKYPYDKLLEKIRKEQDLNRSLYDIAISYQNARNDCQESNINYYTYWNYCGNIAESMEIHVFDMDNTGSLQLFYDYQTAKFTETEVKMIHQRILTIINQVLEKDILLKDIEIVTPAEKHQLLYDFNNTNTEYPRDKTIAQVFEKQAELKPNKPAIVFENEIITYKQFNEKANKLAHYLQNNGVQAHDKVVILAEKSIDLYVSIMAILKIGALYVPVDIEYPEERIKLIIEDCKPKCVIIDKKHTNLINYENKCTLPLQNIEKYSSKNVECKIKSEDGAYIIYTSGSTGKPKGVVVPNRGVVRLVKNTNYIEFKENDRILQNIAVVFDASTFAIFGSFLNGLTLYPINKEKLLDFPYLEKFIKENNISIINSTVSFFNKLIEYNPKFFEKTRSVLIGGEQVLPKTVNIFRKNNPNSEIVNVYGPTENSNLSCCHIIKKDYTKSIPIGIPVSNSTCYILSKNQQLLPIGIHGELYVGGDGVAIEYLNNKKLTNERFIPNIFGKGKLYKTGDLCYLEKDGVIQFISRIDKQVKIRGYRIELKEIETKILEYGNIKECAVVVSEKNDNKFLVAYIVPKTEINTINLNKYLKENLPNYMVPSKNICIDNLPLNVNGKLDTKALPKPDLDDDKNIVKARNEVEKNLVEIWQEVLGTNNIGINQNFFEIGGDSLSAIKLLNLINIKFNMQITIKAIFDMPTIEELAIHIKNKDTDLIFDEEKKGDNLKKKNYTEINNLLSKNTLNTFNEPKLESIGDLLLFGSTGFLGSHILDSFINSESGKIYCIVRTKYNIPAKERLRKKLNFYFNDKYNNLIDNRIIVLDGDITEENFGLSDKDYRYLGKNVNTVINSAAIVKHYGKEKLFEDINVNGTSNIINFCKKYNKKLLHCSTLSLMRDLTKNKIEGNLKVFSEKDFYFEQNLNNLYINSKFKAEELIYNAILDGLNACCLRIGNLSNRYSDGLFQENVEENAILAKLKSFLSIGYIPDYLLNVTFDFTPVDICSQAIIKIANTKIENSTFHIINNNIISMNMLISILKELSYNIQPVSEEKFLEVFEKIRRDSSKQDILIGIMQDWIRDKGFKYNYNVIFNSDFTNKYLSSVGFSWPIIDKLYFSKYIEYLEKIGYIGGKKC
ncbi:MAG: amino acid adenylation domain-containing protein [Clostridia bacterium]|nr:amino acid adenylation domain-containing protein [Clostridia bacterium]